MGYKDGGRMWQCKVLSWLLPGVTEENQKNVSKDSRYRGLDLKARTAKYEAGVLTIWLRSSVAYVSIVLGYRVW